MSKKDPFALVTMFPGDAAFNPAGTLRRCVQVVKGGADPAAVAKSLLEVTTDYQRDRMQVCVAPEFDNQKIGSPVAAFFMALQDAEDGWNLLYDVKELRGVLAERDEALRLLRLLAAPLVGETDFRAALTEARALVAKLGDA